MAATRQQKHANVCGWIAMGGGAASATFCLFGLGIVMLQKVFMGFAEQSEQSNAFDEFRSLMLSLHNLWLIFMPIWIGLGILLIVAGFKMRKQPRYGRHVALLCFAGLAAFVPYTWFAMTDFLPRFAEMHSMMSQDTVAPFAAMQIVSILPLVLGIAAFAIWAWKLGSPARGTAFE